MSIESLSSSDPQNPRRRRFGLALGALAGGLGLASIAHARPFGGHGPGHGPHGFGRGFLRLIERLDLTEAQEVEAVRLRRALREEGQKLREATSAELRAIAAEMKKETPDRDAIHRRLDAAAERMRGMAHVAADAVLDFHAKLTPAQKAEVARHIEKRETRMQAWRERMEDR